MGGPQPEKRRDTHECARVETNDRLVIGVDTPLCERGRNVANCVAPMCDAAADSRPIANDPAPPGLLGMIQCAIGILVDVRRCIRRREHPAPDPGGWNQGTAAPPRRGPPRPPNTT